MTRYGLRVGIHKDKSSSKTLGELDPINGYIPVLLSSGPYRVCKRPSTCLKERLADGELIVSYDKTWIHQIPMIGSRRGINYRL